MKNPGDQNVVAFVTIIDDVVLDGEGSNVSTELRTRTAHLRLFGQQLESVDDVVNESVRGCETGVLGDIRPDFVEVLLGKGGQPIRHLRLLGASRATAGLDLLGELSTRSPVVRKRFAASQLIKPCLNVGTKLLARLVAFLQQSQSLADNFAGCLVQTALNLFVHESLELWRQRDVHANQPSNRG